MADASALARAQPEASRVWAWPRLVQMAPVLAYHIHSAQEYCNIKGGGFCSCCFD